MPQKVRVDPAGNPGRPGEVAHHRLHPTVCQRFVVTCLAATAQRGEDPLGIYLMPTLLGMALQPAQELGLRRDQAVLVALAMDAEVARPRLGAFARAVTDSSALAQLRKEFIALL